MPDCSTAALVPASAAMPWHAHGSWLVYSMSLIDQLLWSFALLPETAL